ncbi:hypothetical protein AcV7_000914 [Taiwanofungus camphoratus]|nr:hypothetical protein AcV7_000914 [Antrodia cinnamomea]
MGDRHGEEDIDFQSDNRAAVSARLQSLFLAPPSQPSKQGSDCLSADMRPPRTRPPSPIFASARSPSSAACCTHSPTSLSLGMPQEQQPCPSPSQMQTRNGDKPHPVLRWLTGRSTSKSQPASSPAHSRPASPSTSQYSPSTSTPSTPSSAASALADALHDDPLLTHAHPTADGSLVLPARPAAARLPAHFRPSHPPRYLSDLTRSTLPTAGLSPPASASASLFAAAYTDPFADPFPLQHAQDPDLDVLYSPTPDPIAIPHAPAPAHLPRASPPSARSSLETLRSIHERSRTLHTSAPAQAPKFPSFPDSLRSWFGTEDGASKDSVHALLGDEDRAESAEAERAHIRKKYSAPRNPVVFCHGLLGFDTVTLGPSIAPLQVTHWRGIKDALEANGIEVLITRVPATSTPVDRAQVLCTRIGEAYPGRAVHLIGHSMGGLDCRYLTTHLTQRPFRVLSVTTISTPHRGSSFADHFLSTVGPARMPSVLGLLDLLPNGGGDGKAFEFLTVDNMRHFNEQTPDVEGVRYFSWGAVYEPGLIDTWKWPHSVIMEKEGPNDGLVSLKSAKWGTYLGTLEGVNHLDLIGWVNTARYKWAEIMGRAVPFKPATFYLGIADHLARVVEGQSQGQGREGVGAPGAPGEREEIREEGERAEMADSLGKGAPFVRDGNGENSHTQAGWSNSQGTRRPP